MIRSTLASVILLTGFSASAHEHSRKHAGSAEGCKKMAGKKAKKMKAARNACVAQSGHHFHFVKMKGERCRDDAHDPDSK